MSERKLASVVQIDKIEPLENSDRLAVATMAGKGWRVVVGKDDFKPGDKAVYFEIDSAIPVGAPIFEFLKDKCLRVFRDGQTEVKVYRIKTIMLRGQLSQGLLMPLEPFQAKWQKPVEVGTDITPRLGVKHFDEVAAPFLAEKFKHGKLAGPLPDFIPKTDEERIQNLTEFFDREDLKEKSFEVTEKMDGCSMTIFCNHPGEMFKVYSRNYELKNDEESGYWRAVTPTLSDRIRICCENERHIHTAGLVFQGELCGPGVQSNKDKFKALEWNIFRIFDPGVKKFLTPKYARMLCEKYKLPYVRVVDSDMKVFEKFKTIDELLEFADGKTIRGNAREGLVFKCNDNLGISETFCDMFSFKAVSNAYLLSN